jgi:putative transposase
MPRKHRIWYPGAIYHIICRGNHREDIYRSDHDRLFYLRTLKTVQHSLPYSLHAYCLMTNHVHLQMETSQASISDIMKRINMLYTIYFNKKYETTGHLLQGRYRAELIDNNAYFLETSRYIHLNPVRANIVQHPLDYPWSSYQTYADVITRRRQSLVTTDKILRYFPHSRDRFYLQFVESILGEEQRSQSLNLSLSLSDERRESG